MLTSISYGQFKKGADTLLPYTGSLTNEAAALNKIAYGEEVVFLPDLTASGTPEIAKMRAFDGTVYSAEVSVKLALQTVYSTPNTHKRERFYCSDSRTRAQIHLHNSARQGC